MSAIVTTRNEASNVERCLSSVRSQTYTPIEVIVVDNRSTDATVEIAERYADAVLERGPERSAQRNAGAARAQGGYLLFLDADMELEPDVVAQAVAEASAGASAVVVPERSVGAGLWSAAKALERSCYVGDDTIEAARFFRRDAFERIGGYDEELTGPEDWDAPARLGPGARIGRTEAWIVHHEGRLTLGAAARKKYYYGRSFARYVRRHPRLAAKQTNIIRPAFLRHRRRLASQPLVAGAMVVLKLVEYASGGAGLAAGSLHRRRSA